MPDRLTIEGELAAHYDHEAEDRERRPLSDQRLQDRNRFLAEIDMSLPMLEVGNRHGSRREGVRRCRRACLASYLLVPGFATMNTVEADTVAGLPDGGLRL